MSAYPRLGVKTYITGGGNGTPNGGAIMWPQLYVSPQCLEPGKELIVAQRVKEVLGRKRG